jgi:ribose 5-phosphate isomerase B
MKMYTTPIILGSDHAGFALKEKIKQYLRNLDIEVKDIGTFSEASVNYAEYGRQVASSVSSGDFKRGILVCGSGIGMSMVANRFPHVRAALCQDVLSARLSRLHNDANILVMGGRLIGDVLAEEIVKTWLETPFEGGRHLERLNTFDRI